MIASLLSDLLVRSFAVGICAAGVMLVWPRSSRAPIRQWVPVAAFVAWLWSAISLLFPAGLLEAPFPVITAAVLPGSSASRLWLGALWLIGFSAVMMRLFHEWRNIRRMVRSAIPASAEWQILADECRATLGSQAPVRVLFGAGDLIPCAIGLWDKIVLLPKNAATWSDEQRRIVLLHELGHFRRGDLWFHALGRLACALHWFNPFAWALARQLATEREFACDALVLARGATPDGYATLLWQMAVAARQPARSPGLAMAAPGRGTLEQRVMRILEPAPVRRGLRKLAEFAVCTASTALLIFCASCRPSTGATSPQETAASDPEVQLRLTASPFPDEER